MISRIIKVEVSAIAKLKGSCVICEPSIKYHSAVMLSIGQLSIAMSVDCWSTCQSIHSTDMAVSVSANISVDMSTLSADLSVDISAFSRSTIA